MKQLKSNIIFNPYMPYNAINSCILVPAYPREQEKNPNTGTIYIFHQLVEALQTEKGPRNNVILYMGRLTLPQSSFKVLAEALENRLKNRKTLFPRCSPFHGTTSAFPENRGRPGAPLRTCFLGGCGKIKTSNGTDVYLAITAEYLAWHFSLLTPDWTQDFRRVMKEPWFATDIEGLKALLAMENPAAFRRRNLFVSQNALSRA
ncbi:MAG: hypothetical protein ACYCT9_07045 [Leptospirillum sp.]